MLSLDVFRGLTLAGMMLVNNAGRYDLSYSPLRHAEWNGITFADFIFPSFVFIMGVAIAFATADRRGAGRTAGAAYLRVFRRFAILFVLGFIFSFDPTKLPFVRILGVLQRLALLYLFTTLIAMNAGPRGQAWTAAGLLVLYWALMKLVPVPGYGAGDLSQQGNLAGYIDNLLLKGHLLMGNWEPEGLLHTIPSIASCLIGCLAGHWLRSEKTQTEKMAGLSIAGSVTIVLGIALMRFFPMNKNLWGPPFVFVTSGAAMNALAACTWLVDFKGIKRWTAPFVILGVNSITAYLTSDLTSIPVVLPVGRSGGHTIFLRDWIFDGFLAPALGAQLASFVYSLACVSVVTFLMWQLYRKKIFIKI
jgi:predicted acyltransferase